MNVITHRTITIDYDVWEPQAAKMRVEEDHLIENIKTKTLLPHAGNVKILIRDKE